MRIDDVVRSHGCHVQDLYNELQVREEYGEFLLIPLFDYSNEEIRECIERITK